MLLRITLEDETFDVGVEVLGASEADGEQDVSLTVVPESVLQPPHHDDTRPEDKVCRSPIAGMVVAVDAVPGQQIGQHDPLVTIEAMKMQNCVGAPVSGLVEEVLVKAGDTVKSGQILCTLR